MEKIICLLPLLPLRKEPSHKAEMTSQLLFGEKADIINQNDDWIEVKTCFDNYTGWMEFKSAEIFEPSSSDDKWAVNPFPILSLKKNDREIYIPAGAEFPIPDDTGYFKINGITYKLNISEHLLSENQNTKLSELALKFENAPYLWGGRSILGIDCSGFVQILFKIEGITLPRDATDQALVGATINSIDKSAIGDLLFFNNDEGRIVHAGMIISPGRIIHSSGFVRIDKIDSKGIFNETTTKYTHSLKIIKRVDSALYCQ